MRRLNVTHPQINLEDFIYYYHIAHKRKNIRALNQLCHLYPELSAMTRQNTITTAGTRLPWEAPI